MEPWHYAELFLGCSVTALMATLAWSAQRVLRQIELIVSRADMVETEMQKMALRVEMIRGDIMLVLGQAQASAHALQTRVDVDHERLGKVDERLGKVEDVALRTTILVEELSRRG